MLQFIEFLEEIEHNDRVVVVSGEQVAELVKRFGNQVLNVGFRSRATDGSIEVPMSNILEAVQLLDSGSLSEAVQQLKSPERLAGFLNQSCAAEQLIAALAKLRLEQFERRVLRYQDCKDAAEAERLRAEISSELFGA
jgi:hypothetical protein